MIGNLLAGTPYKQRLSRRSDHSAEHGTMAGMSVTELDTIDLVSARERELVLTVSDPLPFDDDRHLDLLQAKLNCYLAYIESAQFEKDFPESVNSDIVIEVVFQHPPEDWADDFLPYCRERLDDKGIDLRWTTVKPVDPQARQP